MKVRFFNPGQEYKLLKKEILPAISKTLSSGQLILGNEVKKFEKKLANYVGVKYACSLNSCTDALYLALRHLGIGPGDTVMVPSRTFVASVQVIVQLGADPLFYDTDGGMIVNEFLGSNIEAIIPVHIEGAIDTNMKELLKLAKERKIPVIEDAAQALGSKYKNKMAGSIGLAGCFSFYPAKILGACGDAGALVTNNKKMYEYVRDARHHFKNDARDWGINSRLDNVQAAILNVKFKYHKKNLARRQKIAEMYDKGLDSVYELPKHTPGRVWQDYIIAAGCVREDLYNYLNDNGIETMKNNYPFPVKKLPFAQQYEDETLRLPCNQLITDKEVKYVIKKVNEFLELGG